MDRTIPNRGEVYMKRHYVILVLSLLLAQFAAAELTKGSGTAYHEGHNLVLKSAIAVWDPQDNSINFYMPTFRLTADEMARFKKQPSNQSMSELAQDRPYLKFELEFAQGVTNPKFRTEDVYFQALTMWLARDKGYSYQTGETYGAVTLTGNYRKLGPVKFSAKGEEQFAEDGWRWNVNANCSVLRRKSNEELLREYEQSRKQK
jgi:hypothetical protein